MKIVRKKTNAVHKKPDIFHYIFVPLIIIFGIYLLLPLFRPGFFVSDDGEWMIIRLSAFYQSLREGQFPVRFLGRLNYGYGYPVSNFLYPGFLYLGSVLHMVGFSFTDSVKMIFIGSVIGLGTVVYVWLSAKYDKVSALCGSLAMLASPYLLFDIFKRGSVGEVLAIFLGCLSFISIERKAYHLTAFLMGGLILSHNTVAFMFMLVCLSYIFIFSQYKALVPVLLALGSTAFFWLVVLIEQRYVIFSTVAVSSPFAYFASGENLGLVNITGLLFTSVFLIYIFYRNVKNIRTEVFFASVFLLSLFLATPMSAPIWTFTAFSRLVQFPFRFLSIGLLSGAVMIAYVVSILPGFLKKAALMGTVALSIILASYWHQRVILINKPESIYTTNEATTTVADEYLPKWVTVKPKEHSPQKISYYLGKGTIIYTKNNSQSYLVQVSAEEDSVLQVNTIYYPGWGIIMNNQPQEISYSNEYGVMRINVPKGKHTIYAAFRETPLRFLIDILSLVFFCLSLGYSWLRIRVSGKKGNNA